MVVGVIRRGLRLSAALTVTVTAVLGSFALRVTSAQADGDVSAASATNGHQTASSVAAWNWIKGQLTTGTAVTSPSTITADQQYAPTWTGRVSGRFTLQDVPVPPTSSSTPVVVDSPTSLDGTYRGVVTGHVSLPAEPGRWIINVVRLTPAGIEQAGVQTLVAPDGSFVLDLAATSTSAPGEWGLQVLDATQGYQQTGSMWPQPQYFDGLVVRAVVVTDMAYVIGEAPARADFSFAFDFSHPGAKVFQLVDTAADQVLAEYAPDTGLVRSYDVPATDPAAGRTFTYDQALALITAQSLGDPATAARLARGLVRLQTTGGPNDGAFVSSTAALNPDAAQLEHRTGNHSIATYALLRYLSTMAPADPDRPAIEAAAAKGVTWLLARQVPSGPTVGHVTGGQGAYSNGTFDPGVVLPWASTEHNLDAWHTLRLAESVFDSISAAQAAGQAADLLEAAIMSRLWVPATGRFLQGWQPDGADTTRVLDVHSWGVLFLHKTGRSAHTTAALTEIQAYAATDQAITGYGPRLPATSPVVWFEGSAGVALAQHRVGANGAAGTLDALAGGQLPSGAFPEATRVDNQMDMTTAPAVAATTWMLLARLELAGQPTIWSE